MGKMAGIAYNADVSSDEKNYSRGIFCVRSGHGRVLEYADVFFTIEGYSIKVMREFYTHIGGAPTRLQESTRYVNESDFEYNIPPSIMAHEDAVTMYASVMDVIDNAYTQMVKDYGIPKEDASNILPLGMATKVACRFNARTLSSMAEQRLCSRAYHEYRDLMDELIGALEGYSEEWKELCDLTMKCKCDKLGYCTEEKSCGRKKKREDVLG